MDNIIERVAQRVSVPQAAGIAAGLTVIAVMIGTVGGNGESALADMAVGSWTCSVVQSGEPSSVETDRADAMPEDFDGLSDAITSVRGFALAGPEDQMLYQSGYSIGEGSVTIYPDGRFETVGLVSSRVESGTWSIEDDVSVVRLDDTGGAERGYAARAESGEPSAALVSWRGSSSRVFEAQVGWRGGGVNLTLNSANAIYAADCFKMGGLIPIGDDN